MKLNPTKCAFGVELGKIFGFMVNHWGIEVNSAKAHAVIDLQPLHSVKEVQRLTSIIVTLSRFVSRSTDKCHPLFQALKVNDKINWDKKCEEAFQGLKMHLASPPLLSKSLSWEILYVYLACQKKLSAQSWSKKKIRYRPWYIQQ